MCVMCFLTHSLSLSLRFITLSPSFSVSLALFVALFSVLIAYTCCCILSIGCRCYCIVFSPFKRRTRPNCRWCPFDCVRFCISFKYDRSKKNIEKKHASTKQRKNIKIIFSNGWWMPMCEYLCDYAGTTSQLRERERERPKGRTYWIKMRKQLE